MNNQVRFLGKRFLATIERAPKRLGSLVKVHVCLESALSRETFSTSEIHAPISRSRTSLLLLYFSCLFYAICFHSFLNRILDLIRVLFFIEIN